MKVRAQPVNTSDQLQKEHEFSETDSIMGVLTKEFPSNAEGF